MARVASIDASDQGALPLDAKRDGAKASQRPRAPSSASIRSAPSVRSKTSSWSAGSSPPPPAEKHDARRQSQLRAERGTSYSKLEAAPDIMGVQARVQKYLRKSAQEGESSTLARTFTTLLIAGYAVFISWTLTTVEAGVAIVGIQAAFAFLFVLEAVLRARFAARSLARTPWHVLDLLLSLVAVADAVALTLVHVQQTYAPPEEHWSVPSTFRLLRLLQVVRMLNVFALVDFVTRGVRGIVQPLCGSFFVLVVAAFVAGSLCAVLLGGSEDPRISERFSHLSVSLFSLFAFITLEDWPEVARWILATEPLGIFFVVFISAFIVFIHLVVLNLFTAVMVEVVLNASKDDAKRQAEREQTQKTILRLGALFKQLDANEDGDLSLSEFKQGLEVEDIRAELCRLSLGTGEVEELFDLMDRDRSGTVSVEEFLSAAVQLHCDGGVGKQLLGMHYDFHQMWNTLGANHASLQDALAIQGSVCGEQLQGIQGIASEIQDLRGEGQEAQKVLQQSLGGFEECLKGLEQRLASLVDAAAAAAAAAVADKLLAAVQDLRAPEQGRELRELLDTLLGQHEASSREMLQRLESLELADRDNGERLERLGPELREAVEAVTTTVRASTPQVSPGNRRRLLSPPAGSMHDSLQELTVAPLPPAVTPPAGSAPLGLRTAPRPPPLNSRRFGSSGGLSGTESASQGDEPHMATLRPPLSVAREAEAAGIPAMRAFPAPSRRGFRPTAQFGAAHGVDGIGALVGPPDYLGDVRVRVTGVVRWLQGRDEWADMPLDKLVLNLDMIGVQLSVREQDLLKQEYFGSSDCNGYEY